MTSYPLPKPHPRTDRGPRTFDTSSCREGAYGTSVHRDYAAHWFRWGYATRFIKEGLRVLDVGCGQDQMLVRILTRSQAHVPERYVGVDLNPIKKKTGIAWATVLDQLNIIKGYPKVVKEFGPFDVVTNFEVIEHMPKPQGRLLLKALRACLKPKTGVLLLSTPVYNEKHMAANHIHEYREAELREEIAKAGLVVDRQHGTFMTSQALKRVCTKEERRLVEELNQFYGWDVLANFLAPKYPQAASNICWVLRRPS